VKTILRLLGHFFIFKEAKVFPLEKMEFDRMGVFW